MINNLFFKNVAILMTGTIICQAIAVLITPLLTRLYSPSEFGVFGVFFSIVGVFVPAAEFCYGQAIVLPKKDEDAINLLGVAVTCVLGCFLFSLIVIAFFREQVINLLKAPEIAPYAWLMPFSLVIAGLLPVFEYWKTRRKEYDIISFSRITLSLSQCAVQVFSGFLSFGVGGLLIGKVIGDSVALLVMIKDTAKKEYSFVVDNLKLDHMKVVARDYAEFPKYGAPQTLLNALSQNVPVILLTYFFDSVVVGLFVMAQKIVQLPVNFVINSFGQVFFQKACETVNQDGDIYRLLKKATWGLTAIAIVPSLVLLAWGPIIFSFVLGDQWREAGEYSQWLILWILLGFINVPAITMFRIYKKQKILLYYEQVLLISRIAALYLGAKVSAITAIASLSAVSAAFNLFAIVLVFWKIDQWVVALRSNEHSA